MAARRIRAVFPTDQSEESKRATATMIAGSKPARSVLPTYSFRAPYRGGSRFTASSRTGVVS